MRPQKSDAQLKVVFAAIRQLMFPLVKRKPKIGFHVKHDDGQSKAKNADRWFLVQIKEIVDFWEELAGAKN